MNSLAGHLLIATPDLDAALFTRSVILMIEHGPEGAFGLILNRPTEATATDLAGTVFNDDFAWAKPILLGGPVTGPLVVLHDVAELADRELIEGVQFTAEATKVQELIGRQPEPSRVIANYAGWGPGQLEGEFDWNSWLTLPATAAHVFWEGADDLWETVSRAANARTLTAFLGIREIPPDPRMN